MDLESYKHMALLGTPLAEVFSVVINHDIAECELYGSITVEDDKGTVTIYNAEPEDAETVTSGNSLLLSNRDRAIIPISHFTMRFHLKNKNNKDAEFIRETFSWSTTIDGCYDKCLVKKIKGKLGSATVYYTVYSDAIEAHVGVKFIQGEIKVDDVKGSLDIYGKRVACHKNRFENQDLKDPCQITIFDGVLEKFEKGDSLILDKSVVSLPLVSSLVIRMYLQRFDNDEDLFTGEVEVSARDIAFQYAHRDVKVTSGVIRVSFCAINYAENRFTLVQNMRNTLRETGHLP